MAKAFQVFIVFQLVKPSLPPDSIWLRVLSTAAINHPWRPLQESRLPQTCLLRLRRHRSGKPLRPSERWKPVFIFREKLTSAPFESHTITVESAPYVPRYSVNTRCENTISVDSSESDFG
jgi:hypothetical protein